MKLTLKHKREIVRRFWNGGRIQAIAWAFWPGDVLAIGLVEEVLRDYMNGKFKLKPKG